MAGANRPFWLTAFIDYPAAEFDSGSEFWTRVTGWPLSVTRGEHEEFASLLPPDGADYLRVQRLGEGHTRLHLDVHVPDPEEAALAAQERGASLVRQVSPGLVVMESPAGFAFCLTSQQRSQRPSATLWPEGHHSRVSQVCFDIPAGPYPEELEFWSATLGGSVRRSQHRPEFAWIDLPQEFPFELLTQRLELPRPMGAHFDLGSSDRPAEVARLQAAGAVVRSVRDGWTVLEAPGGMSFCVVDRSPGLPGPE